MIESLVNIKRSIAVVSTLGLLSSISLSRASAQQKEESGRVAGVDSVTLLRSFLEEKRNDRTRLERMLGALNVVDSLYRVHFPTWQIQDEDLRQRIYKSFRVRHQNAPEDTSVVVVSTSDVSEILQVSIGPMRMGRRETLMNLSDSLHRAILALDYPLRWIDTAPPKIRRSLLFGARPKRVSVDASAYGASVLFSNGWGLEAITGNDEIGYPFWLTGTVRAMAILDRLKIGVMFPVKFGRSAPDILEPLALRPRRLNGSSGASLEFQHELKSDLITARLSVGELTKFHSGTLTDDRRPYYLHTIAQLLYSHQTELGGGEHLFTLTGGVGFHQIALGEVQQNERIVAIRKTNFASPLGRLEYVRRGVETYGVGVQYYSSVLLVTGWIEMIRNFVYLDIRYSSPILRKPKPWEQSYFVMVSPRFRVAF